MIELSIWEHVAGHVPPDGPGLSPGGTALPDDDQIAGDGAGGVAGGVDGRGPTEPGEADGVRLLFGRVEPDDASAREVADLMGATLASRRSKAYPSLYERVRGTDVLTYLDPLLELVPGLRVDPERLYDLGRLLVTTSHHRAPVKLGIALFGFFEAGFHVDVLLTLGRHNEFTSYAVGALSRGLDDAEPAVWQLARQATGWGRVHAVRHLARTARGADTLAWVLRHGYRSDVGDEYLACPAATAGRLVLALAAPEVDDELLDAGVDIVRALLRPGAPEGMDDYDDGARATAFVVNLLRSRAASLNHLLALRDIDRFVLADGDWERRAAREWTREVRDMMHEACTEIFTWPSWPARVAAGLRSEDSMDFRQAADAARLLGVDAVPSLLQRLRAQPLDTEAWRHLLEQADEATVGKAVALATERLPLAEIATGPAGVLGSGPQYAAHASLDVVLSGLVGWPGRGWPLVRAGLSSPVVRNRNLALRVLHRWGRSAWPREAEAALRAASDHEPEAEVRRRIQRLLAGQPLEQAVVRGSW